jgi:hypothetical protein
MGDYREKKRKGARKMRKTIGPWKEEGTRKEQKTRIFERGREEEGAES